MLYASDWCSFPLCIQLLTPCLGVPTHLFKAHEFRERQLLCNVSLVALALLNNVTGR